MINLMKQRPLVSQADKRQQRQSRIGNSIPTEGNNVQKEMGELISLLKSFVTQTTAQQKSETQSQVKSAFEIEPRDKEVLLSLPPLPKENTDKIPEKELKLWIANVNKTVFSSAFYYYSKGQMSFEQTKIYCTENILKNLARLNQNYSLNAAQFEAIDKHLIKKVLPYLGTKYPLTDSTEINKKLSSLVEEIDNIEELQNNYFTTSKIGFEYRKQGHYYDVIMRVINDLLNKIDSISENGKTNFQDFQKFMTKIFEKVYDSEWMNRNEEISSVFLSQCLKFISPQVGLEPQKPNAIDFLKILQEPVIRREDSSMKRQDQSSMRRQGDRKEWSKDREAERELKKEQRKKKEEQEKYKIDVKQYTSFLIGRKIPQNVPLFSDEEINQYKISVKHPAVLRILTKWFQQLWKKFEKNYFINRSESIKLQKGENVLDLKPEYRKVIDKLMTDEKKKITNYIKNIEKLNYKLEANILKIQQHFEGENEMDELERICGKFSYKIVKALHNQIVEYLNKVIHSLLTVSKHFHQYIMDPKKRNQSEKSNWPFPPNLISFKLGDLMRCKFSSKQKEIIKVYNEMIAMSHSKQYGQKFKIVRIKNRLKASTNDILINIRFNNEILCQIQLAIKSHASDFIKRSNAFHHYIYQLERSQFGPLTELCSIWMSLDNRAKIYQNLVTSEVKKSEVVIKKSSCRCSQYMINIETQQPFICDECSDINLHNSYILNHLKCRNCADYFVCAKCRIFKEDFQILKNILILQKKIEKDSAINNRKILRDNCMRLINRNWSQFQSEKVKYGLSIFIESEKIRLKTFKLVLYNSKKYLLGKKQNGEFYEIGDISDEYFLREFKKQNILIQIKQNQDILKIDDLNAIKEYILPKIAKQSYRKYKESIVLHIKTHDYNEKRLSNKDCSNILLTGQKSQRQKLRNIFVSDNQITQLPCKHQDFPNIQWFVLSRNPIESLQGLDKFNQLKIFVLENNGYKFHRNISNVLNYFINLEFIEKIVLSNLVIQSIPAEFKNLRRLKCLQLQNCSLNSIDSICLCFSLQKLNIANNRISQIPSDLKNLKKLETLNVHHNPIELGSQEISLPQSIEKKQVCIVNLDLSYCNLKELTFKYSSFANLQMLNLQSNQIQQLQNDIFLSMGKLKLLNLSSNLLKVIPNFTCCSKLSKVYVSNNKIDELPQFLSKLMMDEFKFEGCPIKKIDCIEWLKDMLNESSSILQKYLYWFQKIPFMDYIGFNSKYITKYLDNDNFQNASSSSQQDVDFPFDLPKDSAISKHNADFFEEKEHNSESQQEFKSQGQLSSFKKYGSGISEMNYSNFFHPLKKRLSLHSNDASSDSDDDSQQSQDQEFTKQQFQNLQGEMKLSDNKCTENLTPQTIGKYFADNDLFVFDFQSKIKYFLETTLMYQEFNLYHDENHSEIALEFQRMIASEGYTNATLNIYTGKFTQNIQQDLQKRRRSNVKKNQIFYNDLRKDKIPFTYAVTIPNQKCIEIRNTQLRELPIHLLSDNYQKVILYKIKSLPMEIQRCCNLKWLKIRKSQLVSLPSALGLLKKLERLDLNKNMIETIDNSIFLELRELKVLILSQNKITQMPVVYNCKNLERFYISDNNLQVIPKEMTVLMNLRVFQFNNCPVKVIECGEWLLRLVDKDEAIIHESELCLWKMHFNNKLKYESNYAVQKIFKWSQKVKQEYLPYNVEDDNKHQLFFQQNFREQQIFNRFSSEQFLVFRFTNRTKFEQQKISFYKQFRVIVDKKQPNTLPKFKQFLQYYGLANTKLTIEQIDFIDFPTIESPSCFKCNEQLSYPFYWLKWQVPDPQEWIYWIDKPCFACRNCVEAKPYQRNGILLLQKLDFHKMPSDNIGRNIQPQSLQKASRHSFECRGCKRKQFELGEPRYLCLGCIKSHTDDKAAELLDICPSCMEKVIKKDEKISKTLLSKNHRQWHPFLRILFNTQGYYNY